MIHSRRNSRNLLDRKTLPQNALIAILCLSILSPGTYAQAQQIPASAASGVVVTTDINPELISRVSENIQVALEAERAKDKIPGITFSVFQKNQQIAKGQVGTSTLNAEPEMTAATATLNAESTIFRIASISKLFTTLAISRLIEQGELQRNTKLLSITESPVVRYLLKNETKDRLQNWSQIEIWHLMSHQSGISKDIEGTMLAFNTESLKNNSYPTVNEFFRGLTQIQFLFTPGQVDTGIKYSNYGMNILARLVEAKNTDHLPYSAFISKDLFRPLGMNNSFYDIPKSKVKSMVQGYGNLQPDGQRTQVPKTLYPGAYIGAMGIASTAKDLAQFGQEFLKIAYGESQFLSSPTVISDWFLIKSPVDPSTAWASGPEWQVMPGDNVDDDIWVGHTGTGASERAIMTVNLERNLGIVMMFNCPDAFREKYVQIIVKQLKTDLPNLFAQKLNLNPMTSEIVSKARAKMKTILPPVFVTPAPYPAGMDLSKYVGKYYADIPGYQSVTVDATTGHLVFMGQKLEYQGQEGKFRFPKIPGNPGINSNREPVVFHFDANGNVTDIKMNNIAVWTRVNN